MVIGQRKRMSVSVNEKSWQPCQLCACISLIVRGLCATSVNAVLQEGAHHPRHLLMILQISYQKVFEANIINIERSSTLPQTPHIFENGGDQHPHLCQDADD